MKVCLILEHTQEVHVEINLSKSDIFGLQKNDFLNLELEEKNKEFLILSKKLFYFQNDDLYENSLELDYAELIVKQV